MNLRIVLKTFSGILCAAALVAQIPVAPQPQPKSQNEVDAIMAMFNAPDPDTRIKLAEELMTKFADTEFKPVALQMIVMSYQQKNDPDKMILYSERLLEADPKSYMGMLLMARAIAQSTKEFDLDREEKLNKVEKLAKDASALIKEAPKPRPDVTDEQWIAARKDFLAQAHEALGQAAVVRKKPDVAIAEFQAAIENSSSPDASIMIRLARVYSTAGKYDEALATLDKVLALPDDSPETQQLKQVATEEKKKVDELKAKGAPQAK